MNIEIIKNLKHNLNNKPNIYFKIFIKVTYITLIIPNFH